MKLITKITLGLVGVVSIPSCLLAQSFPLSPNVWTNPDFVDRFLGTYGVRVEAEPKISEAEAELFGELIGLIQNNQMPLAIDRLRTYIQQNTTAESYPSPALQFTLANMLLQEGQLQQAIGYYKTAIQQYPSFLRAYKNLGLAYIQQGNFEEAAPMITKAIELGDAAGDTFGLLGYCYLNLGQSGPALEAYRQATLLNPNNKEWFVGKAEALMRSDNYGEAIAAFEHLLVFDGEKPAYLTSIANAHIALGEPMEAAYILEILYREGEADVPILSLLGDIYLNALMPSLAIRPYLSTFEAQGSVSPALVVRTTKAFLQRGYYAETQSYLDRAEAYLDSDKLSDKVTTDLLNLRAELALGQGNNEKAAEILEQVIAVDPTNGNALLLLGNFNFADGNLEEAEFYYERAAKINNSAVDALIQSARLNVQLRDYAKAIRRLRDAQAIEYQQNVQNFLDAVQDVYDRTR
jgi:tetratricopeptide (TPR) repeat protein